MNRARSVFEAQGSNIIVFKREAVPDEDGRFAILPLPAERKERLLLGHCFRCDEQFVEGRMLPVRIVRARESST